MKKKKKRKNYKNTAARLKKTTEIVPISRDPGKVCVIDSV